MQILTGNPHQSLRGLVFPARAPGDPLANTASEMCIFPLIPRQTGFFSKMLISSWFRTVFIQGNVLPLNLHGNGAAACVTGVSGHRKASCVGPDTSNI